MEMVVKRFTFAAAHRLMHHTGDCRFLHGHNYVLEVGVRLTATAQLKPRSEAGMILDFGIIKEEIGTWIDIWFDHNTLLNKNDPLRYSVCDLGVCKNSMPYLFEGDPTVELMVECLSNKILPGVLQASCCKNVELCYIKMYETETSYCEWRKD